MALSPEIVASQPAISQLDNPSDHINSSAPPAHQEEGEAAAHSPSAQAALPKAQAGASKLQRKRNANITNSLDESCKRFPPDTGKARGIRARIRFAQNFPDKGFDGLCSETDDSLPPGLGRLPIASSHSLSHPWLTLAV